VDKRHAFESNEVVAAMEVGLSRGCYHRALCVLEHAWDADTCRAQSLAVWLPCDGDYFLEASEAFQRWLLERNLGLDRHI